MSSDGMTISAAEATWGMLILFIVLTILVFFFCCVPTYKAIQARYMHWEDPENDPRWNADQFQFSPTSPRLQPKNNGYNRLSVCSQQTVSRGSSFRNNCVLPRMDDQFEVKMPPAYADICSGSGEISSLGTPPAYTSEPEEFTDKSDSDNKSGAETTDSKDNDEKPAATMTAAPKRVGNKAAAVAAAATLTAATKNAGNTDAKPVSTHAAVTKPASTKAATTVTKPISAPVTKPVSAPVTKPVSAPVTKPAAKANKPVPTRSSLIGGKQLAAAAAAAAAADSKPVLTTECEKLAPSNEQAAPVRKSYKKVKKNAN
eukprot:TRINITY_DN18331_c0_g1_i1.p1 TRINITY_DN18331_c0_g1~~TRINITY_DN18331_c0_g1_i1.p1  ORF type:complete len:315 (+),score=86.15 TRINITY_DN18331_c0_g1_i1:140-1084(+)